MISRKLGVFAFALTSTVLACSGAASSEVSVDIETDQVDVTCLKAPYCKPPKAYTPPVVVGDWEDFENVGPEAGPSFFCGGMGPEGDGAEYRVLGAYGNKQCWSSRPLSVDAGFPWGFTLLSLYVCPGDYPVNRCDPYGRCTCWTF